MPAPAQTTTACFRSFAAVAFLLLLISGHTQGQTVTYSYDELGRLVGVVDPSGNSAQYVYDAVGNILSVTTFTSGQVSVLSFTPTSGPPGTKVTIFGANFSAAAANNSVSFNGSAATVISAAATTLVAVVPTGALTGPISVTTPAGSAGSNKPFTVTASNGVPVITSFKPPIAGTGSTVDILGSSFDTVASNNRLGINSSYFDTASAATATDLTVKVPSNAGSGHVYIQTPGGQSTSTADLYIPPPLVTAAKIGFTARATPGTALAVTLPASAASAGMALFDASAGRRFSVQIGPSTIQGCSVQVYDPTNTATGYNASCSSAGFLDAQNLPATGTYAALVNSGSSAGGSTSLTFNVFDDIAGSLTEGGSPVTVTTQSPGQNATLTFDGVTGDYPALRVSGSTYSSCSGAVYQPNSVPLISFNCSSSAGSRSYNLGPIPHTAPFTVVIDPQGAATGAVTLQLTSPVNGGALTPGTPSTLVTSITGQDALVSFAGTAGQKISIAATAIYASGGSAQVLITNPDGSRLTTFSIYAGVGFLDAIALPATGTYLIGIEPTTSGTTALTLYSVTDAAVTMTQGGDPVTVSTTVPGQNAVITFAGSAGDYPTLVVSGSTYPNCNGRLDLPDGRTAIGFSCTSAGSRSLGPLAQTGTYKITLDPAGAAIGSVTLQLTAPSDGGVLTSGVASTLTATVSGQNANATFAGAAGGQISIAGAGVYTGGGSATVYIQQPDGGRLASFSIGGGSGFLDATTLPLTGTYVVNVQPTTSGTTTLTLYAITDVALTTTEGGSPLTVTTTVPGQNAGITFAGTTGDYPTLVVSGSGYPNCSGRVFQPNGTASLNFNCSFARSYSLGPLSQAGNYKITIDPVGPATGSVTLQLANPIDGGALTSGAASTLTTVFTGQNATSTFAGVAGARVSVQASAVYSDGGSATIFVLKPDGTELTNFPVSNGAGFLDATTLPLSGTYVLNVRPTTLGTTGMTVYSLTDVSSTFDGGSPLTVTTSVPGQNATVSFAGTAGDFPALVVNGPAYPGCNGRVNLPDGSAGFSFNCATTGSYSFGPLSQTGTYKISIDPAGAATGSVTLRLASVVNGGTLSSGASTTLTTILPGQNASATFAGATGGRISVVATGLYAGNGSATVIILRPDGSRLTSFTVNGGSGSLDATALPLTGNYTVQVEPTTSGTTTITIYSLTDAALTIAEGGPPLTVATTVPGQNAVVTFNATAGDSPYLVVGLPTYRSCPATVLAPDGTQLTTFNCNTPDAYNLGPLSQTGAYKISINPQTLSTGSVSLQLTTPGPGGTLSPGVALTTLATATGQHTTATFAGTAGARISLVASGHYASGGSATVTVKKPDGTQLSTLTVRPSAFLDATPLPATGTYTIDVQPTTTGATTLTLYLPADQTLSLTEGGGAVDVATTAPGQNAVIGFSGSTGDSLELAATNATYTSCTGTVSKPDGTTFKTFNCAASLSTSLGTLPSTGAYKILVDPQGPVVGGITLQLATPAGAGVLSPNTVTTVTTTALGQDATATFQGTANTRISIVASAVYAAGGNATVLVRKPDGTQLASFGINSGAGFLDATLLPVTGIYSVDVQPTTTGTTTLTLYPIADLALTTTQGADPVTVTTVTPGQNAVVTFAGTAGDYPTLVIAASGYASCAATVFQPDGSQVPGVGTFNCAAAASRNLGRLAQTGTYKIVIDPGGPATGSLTLQIAPAAGGGNLTSGAPLTLTTTTSGQDATAAFAGTANGHISIVASGLYTAGGNATVSIRRPDGTQLTTFNISSGAGYLDATALPLTGTYIVDVQPTTTGATTLTIYSITDLAATATQGGDPVSVTIVTPGQNAVVVFSATAGDFPTLLITGTTYANCTASISQPDGVLVPGASGINCAAVTSRNLGRLAQTGTYRILIDPQGPATGSLTLQIPAAASGGALTSGATATVTTTAPGQDATATFAGTSGTRISVVGSSLYTANGSATVSIRKPDGTQLTSFGINNGSGFLDATPITVTGTYTVDVQPTTTGTTTLTLNVVTDVALTTTQGADPATVTTALPGQNAIVTFTGSAGDYPTLVIDGSTYTACSAAVYQPDGTVLPGGGGINCAAIGLRNLGRLAQTGTYQLVIDPQGAATGSLTLRIPAAASGGSLSSGSAITITTLAPGQDAIATFDGTANARISIVAVGLYSAGGNATVSIRRPDGAQLGSFNISNGSGFLDATTLPLTGTYTVDAQPATTGTTALTLYTVTDVALTATEGGAAVTVTTEVPGQNVAVTFSAATDDNPTLVVSGPTYPSCTGFIYQPDGNYVPGAGSFNCASPASVKLGKLAQDGTYKIVIDPQGPATGSVTLQIAGAAAAASARRR